MKTIAFVCTGNSFKSIICERFAKEFTNDFLITSAGTNPAEKLNAEGALIMKEKGYSMDFYKPHPLSSLPSKVDYLVKMGCDNECPLVFADKIFDFEMNSYPASTLEEKKIIVDILEKKVKEFIEKISL